MFAAPGSEGADDPSAVRRLAHDLLPLTERAHRPARGVRPRSAHRAPAAPAARATPSQPHRGKPRRPARARPPAPARTASSTRLADPGRISSQEPPLRTAAVRKNGAMADRGTQTGGGRGIPLGAGSSTVKGALLVGAAVVLGIVLLQVVDPGTSGRSGAQADARRPPRRPRRRPPSTTDHHDDEDHPGEEAGSDQAARAERGRSDRLGGHGLHDAEGARATRTRAHRGTTRTTARASRCSVAPRSPVKPPRSRCCSARAPRRARSATRLRPAAPATTASSWSAPAEPVRRASTRPATADYEARLRSRSRSGPRDAPIAVRASASAPSTTARSADAFTHAAANSGWWFTAPRCRSRCTDGSTASPARRCPCRSRRSCRRRRRCVPIDSALAR